MSDMKYTRKVYDKFAEEYHYKQSKSSENFWNNFIEIPAMNFQLRNIVKGKKVLDLGCGSGLSTKRLIGMGAKAIGIDISKKMIEIAKKECDKINFYVEDAQKTRFKNDEFDVVSSTLVVHYFKDLDPLFKEVSRITKKGGYFVFSFHHPLSSVLKEKSVNGKKVLVWGNYFHNKKYTWNMLEGMKMISYHHTFEMIVDSLSSNGFVVEKLIEPLPLEVAKKTDRKKFEKTSRVPSFCIIKARKSLV